MKYKRIVLEVEEDDGQVTSRIVELDGQTVLRCDVSNDFNLQNDSEIFSLIIERITPTSREYATYIKNPFWKRS